MTGYQLCLGVSLKIHTSVEKDKLEDILALCLNYRVNQISFHKYYLTQLQVFVSAYSLCVESNKKASGVSAVYQVGFL